MIKKGRKLHTLVCTCLTAALPALALADPPSDAAVGQIDGILNFCVKSVPSLEKNARLYQTAWVGNASPGARNSKAYKDAYDQVSDALENGNHGQEIAACVAGLNQHGEHEEHEAHHGHVRR
ncbi:MAG TPA: hypothetical protein VLL82_08485 [Mycobacterium sp.]|nr:hypothetical protein [Mycobacterium sp.]